MIDFIRVIDVRLLPDADCETGDWRGIDSKLDLPADASRRVNPGRVAADQNADDGPAAQRRQDPHDKRHYGNQYYVSQSRPLSLRRFHDLRNLVHFEIRE